MPRIARPPIVLLLAVFAAPLLAEDDPGASAPVLIRWTDRRGVVHLTSDPPSEYEVPVEEWLRLEEAYPDRVKEESAASETPLEDLTPGARAEAALVDWWNLAGPKGGFRGTAVVSDDEAVALDRLILIARQALKEARGNDFSPATGRAASELRRAENVRIVVRGAAAAAGLRPEQSFPIRVTGKLIRGVSYARYEVRGRISNRLAEDVAALRVSFFLVYDGRVVASRELAVPHLMGRGEYPVTIDFELPPGYADADDARMTLRARIDTSPVAGG